MKYSFRFVCQRGDLEFKAMLLAASLHRHVSANHEIVACIPRPTALWGEPETSSTDFLSRLGVCFADIENPFGTDYPIGNKLACLAVPSDAETKIFLDSDMLCMHPLPEIADLDADFAARAAGHLTWGDIHRNEHWAQVYKCCQVAPNDHVMQTAVSEQSTAPYFNAGFIAVKQNEQLARAWIECCRLIDADSTIPNKRPWLDQIGLPVAVKSLNLDTCYLGNEYNFPPRKPMSADALPYFFHYHEYWRIGGNSYAKNLVNQLAGEHVELSVAIANLNLTNKILRPGTLGMQTYKLLDWTRNRVKNRLHR